MTFLTQGAVGSRQISFFDSFRVALKSMKKKTVRTIFLIVFIDVICKCYAIVKVRTHMISVSLQCGLGGKSSTLSMCLPMRRLSVSMQ